MKTRLQIDGLKASSTAERDLPERTLWTSVIRHAAYRAHATGEAPAMAFFRSEHFSLLCFYLKLDAASIREKVLARGFATLNKDRSNSQCQ
jgi:hypothetical protein